MNKTKIQYYFFYLSAIVVIIGGLKMASQAAVIIFLSIFIASILSPSMEYMRKARIPNSISLAIILFFVTTLVLGVIYILETSVKDFLSNMPFYENRIKEITLSLVDWLGNRGVVINSSSIIEALDVGSLFGATATTIGNIGYFASKMLLVTIGVAFLLVESSLFSKKVNIIFKSDKNSKKNFQLFTNTIQKYFRIKTFTSLITGVFITVALLAFDVEYPFLWGLLGFILNFIPVVGSIIASVPPLLLSLMHYDVSIFLWLSLVYFIINVSISNILEPAIMGEGLGLSPAMIFFSLIFWGWVLGPVGMFLAVPLTMTLKIAFDSNPNTRWIGVVLSSLKKS